MLSKKISQAINNGSMDTNKAAKLFELEIEKELKKRTKFIKWDSGLAHSVLWLSIIASFASAIMVASGQQIFSNNIWLGIIAGVPGLVVLVEKTIDFSKRSASGILYKIELQKLKNEYDFGKINAYSAAQRLQELVRTHETSFLKMGTGNYQSTIDQRYYNQPVYNEIPHETLEENLLDKKHMGNGHIGNGALTNGNGTR